MSVNRLRNAPALSVLALAVVLAGTAGAQYTTLSVSTLRAGDVFGVTATNAWGNAPLYIFVDTQTGMTSYRPLGLNLGLASSPALFLLGGTGLQFNAAGTFAATWILPATSDVVGLGLHAQALSFDPLGRPTVSSVVSRGVHPPVVSGGRSLTLALGDDDLFAFSFRRLHFPFYGNTYTSMTVDSNGCLWFGTPQASDPTETTTEFLAELPRIAMLWDDLDPSANAQGPNPPHVSIHETTDHVTVLFARVPQFAQGDLNTFACTLRHDGSITFYFDAVGTGVDAIVGITPGGGASSAPTTNLSAITSSTFADGSAIYERFDATNPFDLATSDLSFVPSGAAYTVIR